MATREPLQIWPDASLSRGAKKTMKAVNDVWVDCSLLASKKRQKKEEEAKDKGNVGADLEGHVNNSRERGTPGEEEMESFEILSPVIAISGVGTGEVARKGGEEEGVKEDLKTGRNAIIGKSVSVLAPRKEQSLSAAKVEITNGSGEEGTGERSGIIISLDETEIRAKKKKTETNPTPTPTPILNDRLTTTITMRTSASTSASAPAHSEHKKENNQAEDSNSAATAHTTTSANTKTKTTKIFPITIPMRIPMQIPIKLPKLDIENPHMQPEANENTETSKTTKSETLDIPGLFNSAKNVKQILFLTFWFLLFCTVVVLLDGPAAHAKTTPGLVFRGVCWVVGGFLRGVIYGAVSGIFPKVYRIAGEVVRRLGVGMLAAFRG